MAKSDNKNIGLPGAYLWEPPGKAVSIYIGLDTIDRLSQDVMRGFGAVPKRGAEVGGILAGRILERSPLTIEVVDYELVPIEYKRGPSYLLSEGDFQALEAAYLRLRTDTATGFQPVGLFRSQTRDAAGLGQEDMLLLDRFFPGPDPIVLLIKPYATKVSVAGFYFKEGGVFAGGPPILEFPFRRKELGGEDAGSPSARAAPSPMQTEDRPIVRANPVASRELVPAPKRELPYDLAPQNVQPPEPVQRAVLPDKGRSGWVWLPLSFIFLLLGVLLGFQAALTLRPQPAVRDPYTLSLSVTKDGSNLSIRWDRQAAAIRNALSGVLVIEDGTSSRPVALSRVELETGSVVYPPNTRRVKLRLELTLNDRIVLTERLDWRE